MTLAFAGMARMVADHFQGLIRELESIINVAEPELGPDVVRHQLLHPVEFPGRLRGRARLEANNIASWKQNCGSSSGPLALSNCGAAALVPGEIDLLVLGQLQRRVGAALEDLVVGEVDLRVERLSGLRSWAFVGSTGSGIGQLPVLLQDHAPVVQRMRISRSDPLHAAVQSGSRLKCSSRAAPWTWKRELFSVARFPPSGATARRWSNRTGPARKTGSGQNHRLPRGAPRRHWWGKDSAG